jgi:hypothetical protein
MSLNVGSPSPMQPLSLGNVVSAAVQLYRSHFKSYVRAAFIAYLWIFIPIYGWAKLLANLALISRLGFGELVNQSESVETGRRYVNSRLWQFFVMGLLMFVISTLLIFIIAIPLFVFGAFFAASVVLRNNINGNVLLWSILLFLIILPILLIVALWLKARLFLVELPLAIEENVDGVSTISRSWNLTNGYAWRIVLILLVAYLTTIPLQLPFSITSMFIQQILRPMAEQNSGYAALSFIISLILSLASAIFIVPFWQSIKAVIYYDLRTRREGLGLKLRDHTI